MNLKKTKLLRFSFFLNSLSIIWILLLYLCVAVIEAQNIVPLPNGNPIDTLSPNLLTDETVYILRMTGAVRTRDNQTVCTGFTLPQGGPEFWIIQFSGIASASVVHHMTLYACDAVPLTNPCRCELPSRSPLYSWVRNTPKVRYTGSGAYSAAGFRIGGSTYKQYLFLEIHYMHASLIPDQSGITIHTTLTSILDLAIYPVMGLGTIPANTNSSYIDTCATFSTLPGITYIIGFQVHTHGLGRRVSAYLGSTSSIAYEIGRGNPLWPEAYISTGIQPDYPLSPNITVYSRCEFQTTGVPSATNTNGLPKTDWQEMCIFNLLVMNNVVGQLNGKNAFMKGTCTGNQVALINQKEATISKPFLPTIPALDTAATYGNITGIKSYSGGPNGTLTINLDEETFTDSIG